MKIYIVEERGYGYHMIREVFLHEQSAIKYAKNVGDPKDKEVHGYVLEMETKD